MAQLLHCLSLSPTHCLWCSGTSGSAHKWHKRWAIISSSGGGYHCVRCGQQIRPQWALSLLFAFLLAMQSCAHSTLANHRTATTAVIAVISIHTARQPCSLSSVCTYTILSITAFLFIIIIFHFHFFCSTSIDWQTVFVCFMSLVVEDAAAVAAAVAATAADGDGDHCLCSNRWHSFFSSLDC